jgi:hypothetical protein
MTCFVVERLSYPKGEADAAGHWTYRFVCHTLVPEARHRFESLLGLGTDLEDSAAR